MEIVADNVNVAYAEGLHWLHDAGLKEPSRNGAVLVSPEPVLTVYRRPRERVLFSPLRDANPFFHLMEALWMLAGRHDLEWPLYFNSRFKDYSDDGRTVWGAYGRRWRHWFTYDQLQKLAEELRANPTTRRAVLGMWDATDDLHKATSGGKDVPCNTHAYFDCRSGRLNMTVCCRSNDVIWGAYGANVVHFSILQEFLAAAVGVPVGLYRQFSNNFHLYTSIIAEEDIYRYAEEAKRYDLYNNEHALNPYPLVSVPVAKWLEDLHCFLNWPLDEKCAYQDNFFTNVARPMYLAWYDRKNKVNSGLATAERIAADDWRTAAVAWIQRREQRKQVSLVTAGAR